MSFGTMFTILFTWYFQSLGISLGVLPTAILAVPFAIIFMIGYMLLVDKFVFKYYRINKSPPVQLAMVSLANQLLPIRPTNQPTDQPINPSVDPLKPPSNIIILIFGSL